MSDYGSVFVNGNEVLAFANELPLEVLYLFAGDELLHLRGRQAIPYAQNWASGVGAESDGSEIDDDMEEYVCQATAATLKDRLNVLGFGESFVRSVVVAEAKHKAEITRNVQSYLSSVDDDIKAEMQQELNYFLQFSFDAWNAEISKHFASTPKPHQRTSSSRIPNPLKLLDYVDPRLVLRVIADNMPANEPIVLNVTSLVKGGWMEAEEGPLEPWPTVPEVGTSLPIIITEGSYDVQALRGVLEVVKPHLVHLISLPRFRNGQRRRCTGGSANVEELRGCRSLQSRDCRAGQ